jgi:monoamine oxidase
VSSTEVLIVGAGVAGLAAARALTRAGRHCTILEARRRIGGRIHTLHDPVCPVPVELGAEFVHGKPPEIWPLVESGRLPALELTAPHVSLDDGKPRQTDWEDADRILSGLSGAPEQSFAQYLETTVASPGARRSATAFVEGFNAARKERISVESLAESHDDYQKIEGDRSFRLAGGYGALVDWLWSEIDPERRDIFLGIAVESVEWKRGEVRIAAGSRRFTSPRALVTLPLGVLKSGRVRFDPVPAVLQDACAGLEMGAAARIVLRFRRPLWEDHPDLRDAGFLFSDGPWMGVWWTSLPVRAPVITGWCGGPCAETAPRDLADWPARAVESLARVIGIDPARIAAELETWHAHDWSADPFSLGAYSYVGVGGRPSQQRFADPVEDTLYFAGEAVDTGGYIGTVHGAIASGERAAARIVLQ